MSALDQRVAAILIFAATYFIVAIGKVPVLRLDRAGAALLGAALMVAVGVLSLEQAQQAIDLDTITLLLGMMILVANLRLSGFFRVVTAWSVRRVRHPVLLLAAIVLVSGLLSAFLVNDAICIVLTPLVLELVQRLRRDPVPYLLAVAMASNAGSTATITGNPQNMIIGTMSGIGYARFIAALAPVAAIGLALTILLLVLLWPREFWTRDRLFAAPPPMRPHRFMLVKTLLVAAALVAAFFAGVPPAKAALVGGAVLLLTRAVKPEKIYAQIDWTLLLMFAGLFVVVAGLERAVLMPDVIAAVGRWHLERAGRLAALTAVLSNLVSNVPAVLVLKPFVARLADPAHGWLVVAMASTMAGNLTVVGSVANLIVVQRARSGGCGDRVLGLLPRRRAADGAHDPCRCAAALRWVCGSPSAISSPGSEEASDTFAKYAFRSRGLRRPSAALEKFASRFDGTGALLAAGLAAGIVIAVALNSCAETGISGEQAEGVRPWWREMFSNAGPALIVFVFFVLSSGVLTGGLGVAGLAVEGIELSFQTAPSSRVRPSADSSVTLRFRPARESGERLVCRS